MRVHTTHIILFRRSLPLPPVIGEVRCLHELTERQNFSCFLPSARGQFGNCLTRFALGHVTTEPKDFAPLHAAFIPKPVPAAILLPHTSCRVPFSHMFSYARLRPRSGDAPRLPLVASLRSIHSARLSRRTSLRRLRLTEGIGAR